MNTPTATSVSGARMHITVFTPSAADPVVLRRITVGRSYEFATLTRAVGEAAKSAARPHVLLVGPRGSGKSHLLALAADHIRSNHAGEVVLAWLPEDEYAITSYRDLLAEITRAATGTDPKPAASEHELESTLRAIGRETPVVAVVENLDRQMRMIDTSGQEKLRAFLHNEQALLLLASTPSLFEGVTSHGQPFYGAFRVVQVGDLDVEDGRELLLRLAQLSGDERLGAYLSSETGLARLRAVAHLAGGSPRLWMMLAGCVTVELLDELVPLFAKLLDDLTPYYKARMDELPAVKAKLVSSLCLARGGGAMTVKELGEFTNTSQQSVSSLLRQLEQDRFVTGSKPVGTDRRVTYYEVREPLLRHCLELKRSQGRPLAVIVEVLRGWYDVSALRGIVIGLQPGTLAERYAVEALRPELPPQPMDAGYANATIDELIEQMRVRLADPAESVATATVEAIAVEFRDGSGRGAEVLHARLGSATQQQRETARNLFDHALKKLEGAEDITDALTAAAQLAGLDHPYLTLIAGGWNLARQRFVEADSVLRPAYDKLNATTPDGELTLALGAELAVAKFESGDLHGGLQLGQSILHRRLELFGPDHPDTFTSRSTQASFLGEMGNPLGALHLLTQILVDRLRVFGPFDYQILVNRLNIAYFTCESGDATGALLLHTQLLADCETALGKYNRVKLCARANIADQIGQSGDPVQALDLYAKLLIDQLVGLGANHPDTLATRAQIAFYNQESGDLTEALHILSALLDDRERILGPDHPSSMTTRHWIAFLTAERGRSDEALHLLRALLRDYDRVIGAKHKESARTVWEIAKLTSDAGRHGEALRFLIERGESEGHGEMQLSTLNMVIALFGERVATQLDSGDKRVARDAFATVAPMAGCAGALAAAVLISTRTDRSAVVVNAMQNAGVFGQLALVVRCLGGVDDADRTATRRLAAALATVEEEPAPTMHRVLAAVLAARDGDGRPLAMLPKEERDLATSFESPFEYNPTHEGPDR